MDLYSNSSQIQNDQDREKILFILKETKEELIQKRNETLKKKTNLELSNNYLREQLDSFEIKSKLDENSCLDLENKIVSINLKMHKIDLELWRKEKVNSEIISGFSNVEENLIFDDGDFDTNQILEKITTVQDKLKQVLNKLNDFKNTTN